jgi:hypothetical protein
MAGEEKTFLVVGGLAVAAVVVIALVRNAQANAAAVAGLNEPGLVGQAATPSTAQTILGGLLAAGSSGGLGSIGTGIAGLFSGAGSSLSELSSSGDDDNDPGLDTSDDLDYDGTDDYSDLADENSYDPDDSGVESLSGDDD